MEQGKTIAKNIMFMQVDQKPGPWMCQTPCETRNTNERVAITIGCSGLQAVMR